MEQKQCKDCGRVFPVTREFFGQFKSTRSDGSVRIGYRNSCRECMAENTRRYDSENPDNVLARRMRREQRTANGGGSFSSNDIIRLRQKLQDKCRFCAIPLDGAGEIEHLTPVSRGGSSNPNNLTLSCHKCNKEKTNKTLDEYLEWRKERKLSVRAVSYVEAPDKPTVARGRKSY